MIELEVKFSISEVPSVLVNTPCVKESAQTDYYYDTPDYALLRYGNFLRIRNNRTMDFKMDVGDDSHLFCEETSFEVDVINTKHKELQLIFNRLSLPFHNEFTDITSFLLKNNLFLLAPVKKERKIFDFDDIKVTLDSVDGLGLYIEAEQMLDDIHLSSKDALRLKQELVGKLLKQKIILPNSQEVSVGYVELYLKSHNPKAYDLGKFKE